MNTTIKQEQENEKPKRSFIQRFFRWGFFVSFGVTVITAIIFLSTGWGGSVYTNDDGWTMQGLTLVIMFGITFGGFFGLYFVYLIIMGIGTAAGVFSRVKEIRESGDKHERDTFIGQVAPNSHWGMGQQFRENLNASAEHFLSLDEKTQNKILELENKKPRASKLPRIILTIGVLIPVVGMIMAIISLSGSGTDAAGNVNMTPMGLAGILMTTLGSVGLIGGSFLWITLRNRIRVDEKNAVVADGLVHRVRMISHGRNFNSGIPLHSQTFRLQIYVENVDVLLIANRKLRNIKVEDLGRNAPKPGDKVKVKFDQINPRHAIIVD